MELVTKNNGNAQGVRKADDQYAEIEKAISQIDYLAARTGIEFLKENDDEGSEENAETEPLTLAQRISELEELAVDIAEIEVEAGNLDIEDIPENLQEAVKIKLDDSKRLDK